jgi:hypothetical protein
VHFFEFPAGKEASRWVYEDIVQIKAECGLNNTIKFYSSAENQ